MKVTGSSIEQLEKNKPRSRCRRWRLWLSTEGGRKSRRFRGTWTDAQDALKAFASEVEGTVTSTEQFGAYAASWAAWRASCGRYAPNTLANDARCINALRRTKLWTMDVSAITPQDCRDALAFIREIPVRASRLSGKSMAKIHGALAMICRQAFEDGLSTTNPMANVAPPKVGRVERAAFSPDELRAVVDALLQMPMDAHVMACLLMACLGLRRGEACALLDVDIRGGFCHVHQAVKERDGSVGEPKSRAGDRMLPVPAVLQSAVDRWRDVRRSRGLADAPTLCCNSRGGVLRPQNLQRWWDANCGRFMCGGFTTHQLRHSNLSMVARHMSPFDLQRYAGWSSLAPARIYVHDDLDAVSRAVAGAWGDSVHQNCTT